MALRLYITLFMTIIFLVIAFVFGSQNHHLVALNYLVARSEISVAQAVSLFTGLGIIIGVLVTLLWQFSRVIKQKKKSVSNKVQS